MQAPTIAPPPPPSLPVLPQAADLGALQAQVGELNVQLAGLKAQWDGLRTQLDNMLRNNPARPGVQQQWADIGIQMAKVKGDIAVANARIAQLQGRPVGVPEIVVPPPFGPRTNQNQALPIFAVLAVILAVPISFAWARRILRGAPKPAAMPSDLTMRLERMEQAIDTVAIEVERISEGQRFVTRIMAERPSSNAQPAGATADDPSQAKPLALGAGPMEPIVVSDRERVRQRVITPH
jgi:hypothetical protein